MEERLDFLAKWYLRIVGLTYVFMFIPITIRWLYVGIVNEWDTLLRFGSAYWYELELWYISLPFTQVDEDNIYLDIIGSFFYFVPTVLIPYFFWSFWLITLIRWVMTDKHFWQ